MSTFIIAEAGVNHDGDIDVALELVDAAAAAGADAFKTQTFRTDLVMTEDAPQAAYQRERSPASSQAEMVRALELSESAHRKIQAHCRSRGIEFMSTPFDAPSIELLVRMGVERLKVPSGELTNWPLLLRLARTRLPLIVSTGMSTLGEVASALAVIAWGRREEVGVPARGALEDGRSRLEEGDLAGLEAVTVLHCTSAYPADATDVNLRAMLTLREAFGLPVGYSDHTVGAHVSVAAVALGATVIEKHLTLDRGRSGPDHAASADVEGFAALVSAIREVEVALGEAEKRPARGELDVLEVARRSLYAARDVPAGSRIRESDVIALRPGGGLPPSEFWNLVGTRADRDYARGDRF